MLVFLGCDNASTFYRIARILAQKLIPGDNPTVSKVVRSGKVGIGWKGILSGEAQQTVERGTVPEFKSIDDVISVIAFLAEKRVNPPVIVIDEFERIKVPAERMLFADFIKQVGDQCVPGK